MKKSVIFLPLLAAGLAAPAFAQEAAGAPPAASAPDSAADSAAKSATAKAGDTVYDAAGGTVGTVESVEGESFVISTGSKKATLPMSALSSGPNGPVIGMTKAELDAAIDKAGKSK